jgi:hypothetical protein
MFERKINIFYSILFFFIHIADAWPYLIRVEAVLVKRKVNVYSNNCTFPFPYRSGNPGYQIGKPLVFAQQEFPGTYRV